MGFAKKSHYHSGSSKMGKRKKGGKRENRNDDKKKIYLATLTRYSSKQSDIVKLRV